MENVEAQERLEAFYNDCDANDIFPEPMDYDDEDYFLHEDLDFDEDILKSARNTCDLPLTALMTMKYNVSNRAAASITSGILIDLGLVDSVDAASKLVDHNKIYR